MFDNLNLRSKILAVTAVPLNFLALVALWAGAIGGEPFIAIVAAVGAVATLVVAYVATDRHLARLDMIGEALERVSAEELPARLERRYQDPTPAFGEDADSVEPDVAADDEIAQLARAVHTVGERAQEVIDREQTKASRQLAELVKSLARRDQSLLDRQIEHIDWLEDTEQNPDRLEQLFKLDHLATRLRRSSETVLVLAGSKSTRPRGGPAPIATVLRVAMGETEVYTKIKLRAVEHVLVAGGPAFDVAHLVAELLENATQFSPPETPVELHAILLEDGNYQITIIDRGVGMDDDQLALANQAVTEPPDLEVDIGRSIGFIAVGRLARRLNATVDLSPTPGSGVTATVVIPASIVMAPDADTPVPTTDAAALLGGGTEADKTDEQAAAVERAQSRQADSPTEVTAEVTSVIDAVTESQSTEDVVTEAPADDAFVVRSGTVNEPAARHDRSDGDEQSVDPTAPTGRPRVTEDSSHALSKLLGLDNQTDSLAKSNEWSAPDVDGGTGKPLKARSTPEPTAGSSPKAEPAGAKPIDKDEAGTENAPESPEPRRTSQARKRPGSRRPSSKRRSKPSRSLEEALPTGAAFDSGIESLLTDDAVDDPPVEPDPVAPNTDDGQDWTPPVVAAEAPARLTRREKGATDTPTANVPLARASSRKPEEIRSMITRYRDGLKGSISDEASEEGNEDQ